MIQKFVSDSSIVLLSVVFSLFMCTTASSQPLPDKFSLFVTEVHETLLSPGPYIGSPYIDGDRSGNLVAAKTVLRLRSASISGLMRFASLPILGLGINTAFLAGHGYAEWNEFVPDRMGDVVATAISYRSEGVRGQPETQSGMLFLPADYLDAGHPLTWIVYTKGTELKRLDVPSRHAGAESKIGAMVASLGYAVWMPDYPGMGIAPGVQTYCDPGSLARSTLDGLSAARSFIAQRKVESGRLYVMGYSEGGLAAMAVARAISQGPSWIEAGSAALPADLAFSGVYSMGAPLDLTPGYRGAMTRDSRLSNPAYTLLIVAGYARTHPDKVDLVRIVRADIRKSVIPLLGTNKTTDDINRMIAKLRKKQAGNLTAADIFEPDFIDNLVRDPQSEPYFQALSEARMDSWTPDRAFSVTLAATRKDKVVPFENSAAALRQFSASRPEGSAAIRLLELASDSHDKAGVEALLFAVMDIDRKETALVFPAGSLPWEKQAAGNYSDPDRERQ